MKRHATIRNAIKREDLGPHSLISLGWALSVSIIFFANAALLAHLPAAYALIGWPIGALALWGFWTIGHDSLHQALSDRPYTNFTVGMLSFIPVLHPWHATRWIHSQHHMFLNHVEKDTAWNPWTLAHFKNQSPLTRMVYLVMRQGMWWFGTTFFLRRHYALSTVPQGQKVHHVLNVVLILLYLCSVLIVCGSLSTFLWIYLPVYLLFGGIFSTITLLHHSKFDGDQIELPWGIDKSGTSQPNHHTIDYEIPEFLQVLLFSGNLHTAHHLDPRIPFYRWAAASRVIDDVAPGYIKSSPFRFSQLVAVLRNQHLFDEDRGTIVSFNDMEGESLCKRSV